MKLSILAFACILCFGCAQGKWNNNRIEGNGQIETITRTTSDYDGIKCSGSFEYILVKGTEGKITIQGEANLLEYITTEVHNGVLSISTENNVNISPSRNKDIVVTIPFETISQVSLSGSGDLRNTDSITSKTLEVSLAGSGDVLLDINTSLADGSVTGSGDLTLRGTTENLEVGVTGSDDFHGFDLKTENVDVFVTGSGDAGVNCESNLKARVTGSGDIEYRGHPKNTDTKVTGSGSISN